MFLTERDINRSGAALSCAEAAAASIIADNITALRGLLNSRDGDEHLFVI
jgi:hypothetical protein